MLVQVPCPVEFAPCEFFCPMDDDRANTSFEVIEPPFWYGNEDSDHVEAVVNVYNEQLRLLPSQRPPNTRGPVEFCGMIWRRHIPDEDTFTTFDEVRIHVREQFRMPAGSQLALARTKFFVTQWDNDGLPVRMQLLSGRRKREEWEDRAVDGGGKQSRLYCFPVGDSDRDSEFIASNTTLQLLVKVRGQCPLTDQMFCGSEPDEDDDDDYGDYNSDDDDDDIRELREGRWVAP